MPLQDETDDWSSPSSAATNLVILLLAFLLGTTFFGIVVRVLMVCFSIFLLAFKYAVVCSVLLLFGAFLA